MFSSISVQDSHSDKEKILVCKKNYILDNSFLLYRISNRFVQGIAGKKTRYLFLLGVWMLQTKSLLRFMVDYGLSLVVYV